MAVKILVKSVSMFTVLSLGISVLPQYVVMLACHC